MIPKIIHYSWFSGEEMPDAYKQMMATWKSVLPDYEFKLWDAAALKEVNNTFANEAVSVRKWAFAADFIRVYAVFHYGGIWLDGDVVMVKSFDSFLNHRMFIGKEYFEQFAVDSLQGHFNGLTSHCFGAEPKHPFLRDCLNYYENRHFILSDNESLPQSLKYEMRLLPTIQALLAHEYGYIGSLLDVEKEEVLQEDIHVFPAYYFDDPKYHTLDDVYCIHNRLGAWLPVNDGQVALKSFVKPHKKDLFYYVLTTVNKILAKKRLQVRVKSI